MKQIKETGTQLRMRASVRVGHAKVCLMCVTDAEAEFLPEIKQRRRRLVEELAQQWTP